VNKKEAKKTSLLWVRARFSARAPAQRSFLLLFSKKKSLPHRIELTDRTVIGHTGSYNARVTSGSRKRDPEVTV